MIEISRMRIYASADRRGKLSGHGHESSAIGCEIQRFGRQFRSLLSRSAHDKENHCFAR